MVADALDDGDRARVAHAEALARDAAEEDRAARGAVARHVADDDVLLGDEALLEQLGAGVDDDLAAGEALAAAVVRVALHLEPDPLGEREAKRLSRVPAQQHVDGAVGQAGAAVPLGDLVGEDGADGAVQVVERPLDADWCGGLERGRRRFDEVEVEDGVEAGRLARKVVLPHRVDLRLSGRERGGGREDGAKVEQPRLFVEVRIVDAQHVGAPDHLFDRAEAHARHVAAHLLGEVEEEVDHVLRLARKLCAQLRVLRRDADRAGVEVALAHHDAAERDQRRRREAKLLRAEQRRDRHVAARLELAVGLQHDPRAQPVEHERLVGLGEPELPRQARVLDARPRRRAGAAVAARDDDVVGLGLGHAGGDHADAHLGDELHGDTRGTVGALEVVDELSEVLDRVDVVVGRRRDEADAGRGAARLCDEVRDLVAWQLAALARLRALRHLDLDLVGVGEVVGRHAEAARGDLLDGRAAAVRETARVLAPLARVRLPAELVHRDGERLVCLRRDGAERHCAGAEALDDLLGSLHLVERHRRHVRPEGEQAADRRGARGRHLRPDVLLVRRGPARPRRHLQLGHASRVVVVRLPVLAEVVVAGVGEGDLLRVRRGGPRVRVHRERVALQDGEVSTRDARRRAGEAQLHHLWPQPDRLEDLRAAVRLDRADANL
mmetsp:Transcript_19585/g.63107  ORF Transcript_19585/g.63107 Transcript_19585/m.63107 type:complete len:667 (+) Transcript_19585:756-2756(+)